MTCLARNSAIQMTREQEQHGEEDENEQHLALEGAQILLFFVVLVAVRLDFGHAGKEIGAGAIAGGDVSDGVAIVDGGNASDEIALSLASQTSTPDGSVRSRSAGNADAFANLAGAIFRLIVADDATANEFAVLVEDPERIEAGLKAVLQEFVCRLRRIHLRLACEIAQARAAWCARSRSSVPAFVRKRFREGGGTSGPACG